jgi:hypothetical protein
VNYWEAVETAGLMETVEKQTAFSHRFHEPLENGSQQTLTVYHSSHSYGGGHITHFTVEEMREARV